MKKYIVFLFLVLNAVALVLAVSCSNQTPNSAFVAPVQTVAASNPTWSATPTFTFTPSPTATPVYPVSGFNAPYALAIDSMGRQYVGDTGNNSIKQYISGIQSSWPAGKPKSTALTYTSPKALTTDSSGNIYVVGNGSAQVTRFDSNGNLAAQYNLSTSTNLQGLACYGTNLYVSDAGNKKIVALTLPSGTSNATFNGGTVSTAAYGTPYGLAVNSAGTTVYVAASDNCIHIYTSAGVPASPASIYGFNAPYAVALDSANDLFVSDTGNKQVEEFTVGNYFNAPALIFGQGTLSTPEGVATDPSGNVYVVDSTNNQFYQFVP